jgi:hypothetical protein
LEQIGAFLQALPSVAGSPLALIAYLATVVAWTLVAMRVNRFKVLMENIKDLPEPDRLKAIEIEIGRAVPKGMTAKQFLQSRMQFFIFLGFLALCATAAFVSSMALIRVYEQRARADSFINEVLNDPGSAYKSAVTTLQNGVIMTNEAAAEIQPPLTKVQLDEITFRLQQKHAGPEEIIAAMANAQGTSRLQRVNAVLSKAGSVMDAAFSKLQTCFRSAECRRGEQFAKLCANVRGLLDTITTINGAAEHIPGMNLNRSGTKAIMGDAPLNVHFDEVAAPNLGYLQSVCDS